jgi:hypothetical protein
LVNSKYNTDKNFDDGVFQTLKTKIVSANLNIESFAFTFDKEGVFVFNDYSNESSQTLVVINNTATVEILTLTAENLNKLGLGPSESEMKVLPVSLIIIAPLFILASIGAAIIQNIVELRIQRS